MIKHGVQFVFIRTSSNDAILQFFASDSAISAMQSQQHDDSDSVSLPLERLTGDQKVTFSIPVNGSKTFLSVGLVM